MSTEINKMSFLLSNVTVNIRTIYNYCLIHNLTNVCYISCAIMKHENMP